MLRFDYFKRKKVNINNLLCYGFILKNDSYYYEKNIMDNKFRIEIYIKDNNVDFKVIEIEFDEEYILYKIEGATGAFVGSIKDNLDNLLEDISIKCFDMDVFKSNQANEIINYIKNKYNTELEFLWDKFPDYGVARSALNDKWYMLIGKVSKAKLGLKSKDIVEMIDLRYDDLNLIDNIKFFKGYHMNKNSWFTIILDDSLNINEIYKLIDYSYLLANKKK